MCFPLELHVDDVQQALLGGLIFQDDEGKDLRDVVDVKVVEAAAVLVLHPHAHQDDGPQLLLDICAAFSHVPESEVGRVQEVVMKEFLA